MGADRIPGDLNTKSKYSGSRSSKSKGILGALGVPCVNDNDERISSVFLKRRIIWNTYKKKKKVHNYTREKSQEIENMMISRVIKGD